MWDELLALGAQVHNDLFYTDALAVARETMRRARHNIEALISRFEEVGYYLGYGWLENGESSFAKGQPPVFAPPKSDVHERINELEMLAGAIPLSLRAWYETVGTVNLVGAVPKQWHIEEHADPLYIYPIETVLAECADWIEAKTAWNNGDEIYNPGPFRLPIAPDYLHKYNIGGGMWYHIVLPNSNADAALEGERHATTLVNYLRLCTFWGGLPGLDQEPKAQERELAFLTHDLLPL